MEKHSRVTVDFKEAFLRKLLNRGSQSFREVCLQEGVIISTAYSWIRSRGNGCGMTKSKSSQKWSAEEKLKVLIESNGLNEEELGIFLRKEGLHSNQIKEWRAEVLAVLGPQAGAGSRGLGKEDRLRIKDLEKEVNRKDKALAEVSALLILQKKVNLLWERESEEEK